MRNVKAPICWTRLHTWRRLECTGRMRPIERDERGQGRWRRRYCRETQEKQVVRSFGQSDAARTSLTSDIYALLWLL